jgi:hypothetical protein
MGSRLPSRPRRTAGAPRHFIEIRRALPCVRLQIRLGSVTNHENEKSPVAGAFRRAGDGARTHDPQLEKLRTFRVPEGPDAHARSRRLHTPVGDVMRAVQGSSRSTRVAAANCGAAIRT